MAQMVRLSQTRWLSLDQVITVEDHMDSLRVYCAGAVHDDKGEQCAFVLSLQGDERLNLLAFLARNVSFTAAHQK